MFDVATGLASFEWSSVEANSSVVSILSSSSKAPLAPWGARGAYPEYVMYMHSSVGFSLWIVVDCRDAKMPSLSIHVAAWFAKMQACLI